MVLAAPQNHLPIGQLLQQAGLISENQLDLALQNQKIPGYEELNLGEILALRGWVKQETSDFFASRWQQIITAMKDKTDLSKLGIYLAEAHLLTKEQVIEIIQQQKQNKIPFSRLVVEKGYLKQQTLDFFLQHLSVNSKVPTTVTKESQVHRRVNRSAKYFKLGDTQGAILELREAIKLEPNSAQAHGWLTLIFLELNQKSLAKIHLKKAMAVAADDDFVKEVKKKFFASVPSAQQKTTPKVQKQASRGWLKIG
ncbi:MAG: hypothetical protein HC799_04610 [Limnothrix sp. RL_2_0]|nr:hypothetical protein [Limnothrix sp. RL_2_0]